MSSICKIKAIDPTKVAKVKLVLGETEALSDLAEVFKAIGDPGRVKIICALLSEELCVCDLSAAVGMTPSAVSHQLRLLRNLRLVTYRREGQMVFYALDDHHIATIVAQGLEHVREARRV